MPGQKQISQDNILGAISYLWILFLVPLLLNKKNSEFVKFHIKQGIVLFIFELFAVVIGWIPFLGWFLSMILGLVFAILSLLGLINALMGEKWEMPFLGEYAKKIKL